MVVNPQWAIYIVCVCSVKVLEDSKAVLIAANMQADDPFPMDDKIKEGQIMDHYTVTTLCSLSSLFLTRC